MNAYGKLGFILLIAAGLTAISYRFTNKGLKKYYSHKYGRALEIFTNKTNYDVLFIGSSRTHTTVIPRIIDSITGLNSYNAGVDGGTLLDFKMTFDGYLVNHPAPRLLVLTIDPVSFNNVSTVYDPMQYFSFVKNPAVEKIFSSTGYSTFIMKNIPALNYIYMDDYSKNMAFAGLRGKNEIPAGEFDDKGFQSNTTLCIDPVKYKNDSSNIVPVAEQINLFQAIIDTCRSRNIQLVITYAPEYRHQFMNTIKNGETFTSLVYEKVRTNGLMFFRDDSLAMNKDSCLFRDLRHVNTTGAAAYSVILGQRLKNLQYTDSNITGFNLK